VEHTILISEIASDYPDGLGRGRALLGVRAQKLSSVTRNDNGRAQCRHQQIVLFTEVKLIKKVITVKTIEIELPEVEVEYLKILSQERRLSISELIRQAISLTYPLVEKQNESVKESYLQLLREDGISEEELKKAEKDIESAESQWSSMDQKEIWRLMRAKSFAQTKQWAKAKGIELENLTEDEMMQLVSEGVRKVRELRKGK
jgi:hypothetical protein